MAIDFFECHVEFSLEVFASSIDQTAASPSMGLSFAGISEAKRNPMLSLKICGTKRRIEGPAICYTWLEVFV